MTQKHTSRTPQYRASVVNHRPHAHSTPYRTKRIADIVVIPPARATQQPPVERKPAHQSEPNHVETHDTSVIDEVFVKLALLDSEEGVFYGEAA